MKTGLVVGKFWPPHAGHHYLLSTAQDQVDTLVVLVVAQKEQVPGGKLRRSWLQESFPGADVRLVEDIYEDDNSQAWADYTIELLGKAPDVVFTSEEYGATWARCMGSEHVLVDKARLTYPVSGSAVRRDPLKNWNYLADNVRAYYAKRICVLGAESTGTTTLTKDLAEHYKTTWVPEYGREYTYGKVTADNYGATWTSQEFTFIAKQQNQQEDQMARYANKLLFCDTNSFATALWHERYIGTWSNEVEKLFSSRSYELHILTDVAIPFVQDGIRDGEHIRQSMHQRFVDCLEQYAKEYIIVSGTKQERLDMAITAINKRIVLHM